MYHLMITDASFFIFMGWRIVYIEESQYLSLYLDNIKIKKNDSEVTIPLSDIHSLIIDNYKSTLSVNLINKCIENKVNILLCGIDHMPRSIVFPIKGNNQMPKIIKRQFEWNEDIKSILHSKIVKGKITNQCQLLEKHKKDYAVINKLYSFAEEVKNGDPGNREGLSAKMYFRELFGNGFIRFEDDAVNAGLNYGYSILRSQISKVVLSRGLNPSIGIFHRGAENIFNLSDDIIEVFRPIIDDYVYKNLMKEDILTREHRINLIKLTTKKMIYNGEKHTFFNVVYLYINNILDVLDKGIEELIIPEFKYYDI
ncbi:MAG: type II CRISPR-associated endonuclease Cas1 [Bacilli bacterium]|nr:type II CRISPR-associated endonuclease Cas1 [Bacilli bacterium]